MNEAVVTVGKLAAALERWEKESEEGKWPPRADPGRHRDSAQYLIDIITGKF